MTAEATDGPAAPPTATILVLEDDPMLGELIRIYLEGAGYAVLTAHDLDAGTALAEGQPVDLVLSDVFLPGASPPKLAALLAACASTPRLLYMSGRSRATISPLDLLAPAADLVEKPFTERVLIEKVRTALTAAGGSPSA
jgi:DNA-binding response OmpR family regulator